MLFALLLISTHFLLFSHLTVVLLISFICSFIISNYTAFYFLATSHPILLCIPCLFWRLGYQDFPQFKVLCNPQQNLTILYILIPALPTIYQISLYRLRTVFICPSLLQYTLWLLNFLSFISALFAIEMSTACFWSYLYVSCLFLFSLKHHRRSSLQSKVFSI